MIIPYFSRRTPASGGQVGLLSEQLRKRKFHRSFAPRNLKASVATGYSNE
jgi:hypothetical protein